MKMNKTGIWVSLAATLAFGATLSAQAANPTTLRVIVVQTTDAAAYVHEVNALAALYKKAGTPVNIRVWRATFAGNDAGTVVVSAEFTDFMSLAKANEMQRTNQEITAEMKKIAGLRKIVSDSLYEQIVE
jgi:hypothetical protein